MAISHIFCILRDVIFFVLVNMLVIKWPFFSSLLLHHSHKLETYIVDTIASLK